MVARPPRAAVAPPALKQLHDRLGEVTSGDPITVRGQDGVLDALRMMRARGVRRVPVTDAAGALVGVLSLDDVLEEVAEQLGDLARAILRRQKTLGSGLMD